VKTGQKPDCVFGSLPQGKISSNFIKLHAYI